jgi:hypothetical protein
MVPGAPIGVVIVTVFPVLVRASTPVKEFKEMTPVPIEESS